MRGGLGGGIADVHLDTGPLSSVRQGWTSTRQIGCIVHAVCMIERLVKFEVVK